MEDLSVHNIVITFILAALSLVWFLISKPGSKKSPPSSCPNPNCIRCQRYRFVQKSAQKRLPWLVKDLQCEFPDESLARISASVRTGPPLKGISSQQAPTVLLVQGLTARPVVTDLHTSTCHRFVQDETLRNGILLDLENYNQQWIDNDTQGWQVLQLLNQGVWNQDNLETCPNLARLLKSLPDLLLDKCLFGNAFVSKIMPGTIITPHCGPTNIRHRLQYAITIPPPSNQQEQSGLKVAGGDDQVLLTWKQGGAFVFDDSFDHSVDYSANSRGERIVLIVDLWHPELTLAERRLLERLYPPTTTVLA
jgi:hypothetical protein